MLKIIRNSILLLAAIALASAGCGGSGKKDADADVETDLPLEEIEDDADVEPVEADEEDPGEPADPTEDDVLLDQEDGDVPVDQEEEEEVIVSGCGDGILEAPEICDDGNRATEFCGRWGDCIGDCSLLAADCGNARVDPGEECDDGNADSMDYCTTSCNINDHGIGSPCQCPNCYGIYVTREPIIGCEGVDLPPGTGGVLGCVHTMVEPYSGYQFFAAEGYCSIFALKCLGDEIDCAEVEDVGDMDTFTCPTGYPYFGVQCTGAGGIGIMLKFCLRPCTTAAQCMWNGYDTELGECGRMDCVPNEGNPAEHVCFDPRNFFMSLPDVECVTI
jgi:cysteine-rich repeat protein